MYVVIFVTAKSVPEANKISKALVNERLVACVNIIKDINSVFWWQDKSQHAKEVLLIIKSKKSLFRKIVKCVKSQHSYAIPEIIALPVVAGSEEYLDWIDKEVRSKNSRGKEKE